MLEADIRDFFTRLDQSWLERFLEHRIADKRVLRLIQNGSERESSRTGIVGIVGRDGARGIGFAAASNVYLHYVFDLWAAASPAWGRDPLAVRGRLRGGL